MFGLRAWPTPFARPLAPFIIATAITYFGVSKLQDMAVNTPEALADPKNPYSKGAKSAAH